MKVPPKPIFLSTLLSQNQPEFIFSLSLIWSVLTSLLSSWIDLSVYIVQLSLKTRPSETHGQALSIEVSLALVGYFSIFIVCSWSIEIPFCIFWSSLLVFWMKLYFCYNGGEVIFFNLYMGFKDSKCTRLPWSYGLWCTDTSIWVSYSFRTRVRHQHVGQDRKSVV